MSILGEAVAAEARALVGVPFRLQGRSTETGLDCIGLVALALEQARNAGSLPTPRTYRLRNSRTDHHLAFAELAGLLSVDDEVRAGDIVHTRPGPLQDHLLVALGKSEFVHAHAGLRRVVLSQGPLTDPVLHHWRPEN